jgi:hypothetical protein
MMLTRALTLGENETLGAHLSEVLKRPAFTDGEVSKIHVGKGFFNAKFVYFIQMWGISMV